MPRGRARPDPRPLPPAAASSASATSTSIASTGACGAATSSSRCAPSRSAFCAIWSRIPAVSSPDEMLGRACQGDAAREVVGVLERWAPRWLLQMPGVVDAPTAELVRHVAPRLRRKEWRTDWQMDCLLTC